MATSQNDDCFHGRVHNKLIIYNARWQFITHDVTVIQWTPKMVHYDENNHIFSGGQKCWDLSSDISKTNDPSPPTPNKVEFGAKWVEMSPL